MSIIARTHTYAHTHLCACGHIYTTQPYKHLSEVDSRVLLAQLRLTILLVSSEVTLPTTKGVPTVTVGRHRD